MSYNNSRNDTRDTRDTRRGPRYNNEERYIPRERDDRREEPRRAEVGRSGRRRRHRVDRPVPDQGHRAEAHRCGREEGDPVGAVEGRHADVRVRRERQDLRRPGDHLQRLVHHQLPGAAGQGHQ